MYLEEGDNQISLEVRETFLDDATWQKDEQHITGGGESAAGQREEKV